MRMWMVPADELCSKHLLGEHGEIHKHRHNFVKRHSIRKRIDLDQIEPKSMKSRHDELAAEMLSRGYSHQSPYIMPDLSYLSPQDLNHEVDVNKSRADLHTRCEECRILHEKKQIRIQS